MPYTHRIIYCHTTFLSFLCVRLVVPSFKFFVSSRCAVWYYQWLPSGDTHYPPCPLFLHLPAIVSLFLAMYSPVIHKNSSSSALRTALVLITFKILSRRSGVGTCIRHQLNAP